MRHEVIMPALGMAQDSGLIVSWGKVPGEAVSADEILLEVETDKATMEVSAGHDGYLAEILAQAGENVPIGVTIAIITAEKPAETVSHRYGDSDMPQPISAAESEPAPDPDASPAPLPDASGRILASPKTRRLAQIEGLNLERLVEAGFRQPFHVKDLLTLRTLSGANVVAPAGSARRLTAAVPAEQFSEFCDWAAQQTDTPVDPAGFLATMAGVALHVAGRNGQCVVAIERFERVLFYSHRGEPWLEAEPMETSTPAVLVVRDLRHSALTRIALGAETAPVVSLTQTGETIAITLECGSDQLGASAALTLISEFAERLADPLRHLL